MVLVPEAGVYKSSIALAKQVTLEQMPRVSGSRGHSLGSFRTQGEGASN